MTKLPLPPPIVVPGMRIGLFGGSFNPAHDGHVAVAGEALKRLGLHQVWWMISPQNPLKSRDETDDFELRRAAAQALARQPRFVVTDIERRLGTSNTAQTLRALEPLTRRAHFVWVMGADSFATLHRWNDWQEIPARLPLAVFDRPGHTLAALCSKAALTLAPYRIDQGDVAGLATSAAPAWAFISMRRHEASSTALRLANGARPAASRAVAMCAGS